MAIPEVVPSRPTHPHTPESPTPATPSRPSRSPELDTETRAAAARIPSTSTKASPRMEFIIATSAAPDAPVVSSSPSHTASSVDTDVRPDSRPGQTEQSSLSIRTGSSPVTHPRYPQVITHPSHRPPIDVTIQTDKTTAAPPDEPEQAKSSTDDPTVKITRTPADEPPLFKETQEALTSKTPVETDTTPDAPETTEPPAATQITDQPTTPEPNGGENPPVDEPSLDDFFKGLGQNPSAKIGPEKATEIFPLLPNEAEVELVLGEGLRGHIAEMQKGSEAKPVAIYGAKTVDGVRSWYVDLKDRTGEGLSPEQQDSIARKLYYRQTSYISPEEIIESANETHPNSMPRAAIDAGEFEHTFASLNWIEYMGPNHEPELPLEFGGRPDVTDLENHHIGELGSYRHVLESKVAKAGWYDRNARRQYGGTWKTTIFGYDHNRPAWQAVYARKEQEKE